MSDLLQRPKPDALLANQQATEVAQDGIGAHDDVLGDPLLKVALALPLQELDPGGPGGPGDDGKGTAASVDKKMSRGLFDWRISDEDATSSLDALFALSDTALDGALVELGSKGKLKRLFEQLPDAAYTEHPDKVLRMYQHAPPAVLKARVQDLLSLGVFDWAIDKGDVQKVLDLLALMPKAARDELMMADDGKLFNSLMASKGKAETEAELVAEQEAKAKREAAEQERLATQGPGPFEMADGDPETFALQEFERDLSKAGPTNGGGEEKGGFFNKVGKGLDKVGSVGNTVAKIPQKIVQGGFIAGRALIAHKVDLDHVASLMGGDLGGVTFDKSKGNDLSFTTDWDRGLLTVDLPSLGIASVSMDGVTSGKSSIEGLKGEVKYRTKKDTDNHVKLKVGTINLGDTEIAMGGSTWTIDGLKITGVDISAVDPPVTHARPLDKGDGLKLVFNQVKDAIGFNLPAIKAALGGGGPTPETLMEHVGKGLGADADLDIKVTSIDLKSVKQDGQAVASDVDLDNLSLTTRDISLKPRLEAELTKLDALEKPDEATLKRKAELQGLLAGWEGQEARFAELQNLATKGTITPAQEDELITLRNTLRVAEAHLKIDKLDTGKVDFAGNHVDQLKTTGIDVTASGGPLEASKRQKTRDQKLDDLVALKHGDAEVGNTLPVPAMQVSGTVGTYDVDGAHIDPGEYGQVDVSANGTGLGFSYDEASGDVGLTSKTFAVDGLDYGKGASKDYAAYATTLNHGQGEALDFAYNLNSGVMSGKADNLAGDGLKMPGMTTAVDNFAAGNASFTMNEVGDVSADLGCVDASGVAYTATGNETDVGRVTADTFHVDMFDRTLEDGSTSSTMQGSGTGVHAEGVKYHPNDVVVDRVDADAAGFSMVDVARTDGSTSSTITANAQGVDAGGVHYLAKGNETHVDGVQAKDFNLAMQTDERDGFKMSTTDVTATGLDADGVNYVPSDVKVGDAHAETFGFHMLDTDVGGVTSSTMWGEGTGITAGGIDYSKGKPGAVHVDGADATAANFTIGDDGTVLVGGDGVHAAGVDYAKGTSGAVHVGDVKAKTGTFAMGPDGSMSAKGKGVKTKGITYGQEGTSDYITVGSATAGSASYSATANGDMKVGVGGLDANRITRGKQGDDRLEVDNANTSYLGLSMTEDGTTAVSSPSLKAKGIRYGDTKAGKGTTIGDATVNDFALGYADGVTTINSSSITANTIHNGDAGVDVGSADLQTVQLTSGDDLHITADDYRASDIKYTAAGSTKPDAKVDHAFGKKLDLRNGASGLDVSSESLGLLDVKYGDMKKGGTGVRNDWTAIQDLSVHHDANGTDFGASEVLMGGTKVRSGDRFTKLDDASLHGVTGTDVNVGGPGTFSGDVGAKSFAANGVVTRSGNELTKVDEVWGTDAYAWGNGDNKLNAGVRDVYANGLAWTDGTSAGSAGSVDAHDVDASVSGLDGETKLDGLSIGSANADNVVGGTKLWKLLDRRDDKKEESVDPCAEEDTDADADREPREIKADAMRTASGTIKATVPVNVKFFGVGMIGLDVNIKAVAKDGKINLNAVQIDVVERNLGGAMAKQLASLLLAAPIDPKLSADSAGNLELWFEVGPVPVFVNLVNMKDMGVSGGWIAPNVLSLEGLVKGLLTPKPKQQVQSGSGLPFDLPAPDGIDGGTQDPLGTGLATGGTVGDDAFSYDKLLDPEANKAFVRDATEVVLPSAELALAPEKTTTETVEDKLRDADAYVDVGRASIDISALKLGDGAIGNDNFGMTLYDSKKGANQIDGGFVAGSGGKFGVGKVRAKDVYVGDDVTVGDVQVDNLVAGGQKIVGSDRKLNRDQVVAGGFTQARVKDVQVGDAPAGRRGVVKGATSTGTKKK